MRDAKSGDQTGGTGVCSRSTFVGGEAGEKRVLIMQTETIENGKSETAGIEVFWVQGQTPRPPIKFHFQVTKSHEKSRKVIFARFRNRIGPLCRLKQLRTGRAKRRASKCFRCRGKLRGLQNFIFRSQKVTKSHEKSSSRDSAIASARCFTQSTTKGSLAAHVALGSPSLPCFKDFKVF